MKAVPRPLTGQDPRRRAPENLIEAHTARVAAEIPSEPVAPAEPPKDERRVIRCLETEFDRNFRSIRAAATEHGVSVSRIRHAINTGSELDGFTFDWKIR
jgi:hypothetical protein